MARAGPAFRFEAFYRECYPDLLRYALSRSDSPEGAADIVAETFLVAWRRVNDIPAEQPRAWLFGVARKVMANHHRAAKRREDLTARLRKELAEVSPSESTADERIALAFQALPEPEHEILRLVAWDGLSPSELAVALGCSANAARIRLHRARRRLAGALDALAPNDIRSHR